MSGFFILFYNNFLLSGLFILVLSLFISYLIYFFSFKNSFQNIIQSDHVFNIFKVVLLVMLFVSFIMYLYFILFYFTQIITYNNYFLFSNYGLVIRTPVSCYLGTELSVDFFGLALLFLAYFVGILSLIALDNRLFFKNIKYLFSINVFILIVYLYITTSNVLLFFLFYELLLVPSFLLVYYISPSRRAIQASLYFLIWTQIGSFLVLLVIAYLITIVGSSDFFDIKNYNFTYNEVFLIYFMLFLGFGFKVPIWPFHYWLTKTHVEAPSGFSMYLSGFLVKSAVYGFYKLTNLLCVDINTTIFITICVIGVCDASLKMWGQTDLKKLVAYGTIQEMNLIFLTFCWGDTDAILGGILFSITHGALSALMFYLVDCIYRRFFSRSVVEISGILQVTPMLGIAIIVMCVLYAGLPGTLKFTCEFYIFSGLFEISPTLTILLFFIANVLGLIGFSKCWFDVVFGLHLKHLKTSPYDLLVKELYIIYIPIFFLIFFGVFVSILF